MNLDKILPGIFSREGVVMWLGGVVMWLGGVVMTSSISCLSSLVYQDKWSKNVLNIL